MDTADRTPVRPRASADTPLRAAAAAVLAVSFLLLAGCGGGGGQDDATSSPTPTATAEGLGCLSPERVGSISRGTAAACIGDAADHAKGTTFLNTLR